MSEEVHSDVPSGASPTSPLATPARMRARFARFGGPRTHNPVLEPILQTVRTTHPKADTAVILEPNSAVAHGALGGARLWGGLPAQAIEPLQTAMRLSPSV